MSTRTFPTVLAAALLGCLATQITPLQAQVPIPGYAGFVRLPLPGNSDSLISVSFARPSAAMAAVQNTTGNTIAVQGTPGWSTGQFVHAEGSQPDTYYLLVLSGAKAGTAYTITGNSTNALTVDPEGDSLTDLTTGTRLEIIPYWTLGTLFPNGKGVHASNSETDHATEVLFPDLNATGINPLPAATFYFYNGQWQQVGQGTANRNNTIVLPDSHIIVRHNAAEATELFCGGEAISSKLRLPLGVNTAGKRDNFVGLQRPNAVTLADSQLVTSGAFVASTNPLVRTDELYVYDNTLVKKNKSASAVYFYYNNAWRKVGAPATASFDTTAVFLPGTGCVIRKNASPTAPVWLNNPGY